MSYANILQQALKGAKTLGQTYPAASTVGMIGGTGLVAGGLGKALNTALEPSEKKENPLEFKKKQIESTYNYEFTERNNENNLSYMPEMYIENNRLVVKLNDEAEKHANYINMYAAQSAFGQDNRDIVYEIDGKKHAYDFSVFGGTKFTPLEGGEGEGSKENNPFSSYYNYPKVWGEAEPQERWHSDKSEKGIIPPWLKTGSMESNPFTKDLPQSNTMMPEDFR